LNEQPGETVASSAISLLDTMEKLNLSECRTEADGVTGTTKRRSSKKRMSGDSDGSIISESQGSDIVSTTGRKGSRKSKTAGKDAEKATSDTVDGSGGRLDQQEGEEGPAEECDALFDCRDDVDGNVDDDDDCDDEISDDDGEECDDVEQTKALEEALKEMENMEDTKSFDDDGGDEDGESDNGELEEAEEKDRDGTVAASGKKVRRRRTNYIPCVVPKCPAAGTCSEPSISH